MEEEHSEYAGKEDGRGCGADGENGGKDDSDS